MKMNRDKQMQISHPLGFVGFCIVDIMNEGAELERHNAFASDWDGGTKLIFENVVGLRADGAFEINGWPITAETFAWWRDRG